MTTFLNFNVFAAARGKGLRPELRLLFRARDNVSLFRRRH
jgi:hypothetical protein